MWLNQVLKHVCYQCGCPEIHRENLISVIFTDRLTSILGDAEVKDGYGIIRISTHSWNVLTHYQKVELLIHEACHVIADLYYDGHSGYTAHGVEWRTLMRCAGIAEPFSYIKF